MLVIGDHSNGEFSILKEINIDRNLKWNVRLRGTLVDSVLFGDIPTELLYFSQFTSLLMQVQGIKLDPLTESHQMDRGQQCEKNLSLVRELKKCKERERYWKRISDHEQQKLQLIEQDNNDLIKVKLG